MQKDQLQKRLVGLLISMVVALAVAALFPDFRNWMRETFLSNERMVLAKAQGFLTPQGPQVTVIKGRQARQLFIEVFDESEGTTKLMVHLDLPETQEAHVKIFGEMTNLAMVDINQDQILEILAPTFDENLVGRLRVIRFDPASKTFRFAEPSEFPQLKDPSVLSPN